MTVVELLSTLNDLPLSALDKEVYVDTGEAAYTHLTVVPLTKSCEDPTVIGYLITQELRGEPIQLEFDFEKDVN